MCEILHRALGMETGSLGSEGQCQGENLLETPHPHHLPNWGRRPESGERTARAFRELKIGLF